MTPRPSPEGSASGTKLTEEQREAAFCEIAEVAIDYAIAIVDNYKIDAINILQASLLAMRTAVVDMDKIPNLVLVDGNQKAKCIAPEETNIKGDRKSASIMAASILAKVTRDFIMQEEHRLYPQYGFDRHKGYGSAYHLSAIKKYGPCSIHRKSFRPIKSL